MSNRRRGWGLIALAVGLSVAVAACSGEPSGGSLARDEIVDVSVACGPTLVFLPQEYAMRAGTDREHGVELACVHAESGPEVSAAMIAGEIDLALMAAPNLFALLEQEVDIVAFMAVLDRSSSDLVVHADFSLPSADQGWEGVMRDLQGATIGVVARGAAAEDLARGLFIAAGLDPDNATYVATGLPPTTLPALENGEIDAAIISEPGITLALENDLVVQPFSIRELTGPPSMDWASVVYTATREFAEQNTEVLVQFTQIWQESLDALQEPADRAEVVEVTSDFLGVDPGLAESLLERNLPYFANPLDLDPARLNPAGEFFHQTGRFPVAYHVEDYEFDIHE